MTICWSLAMGTAASARSQEARFFFSELKIPPQRPKRTTSTPTRRCSCNQLAKAFRVAYLCLVSTTSHASDPLNRIYIFGEPGLKHGQLGTINARTTLNRTGNPPRLLPKPFPKQASNNTDSHQAVIPSLAPQNWK